MRIEMEKNKKGELIIYLTIFFIALSMRAPMGTVGPLIEKIMESEGLNASLSGFLTTLPLILFALFAPISGFFSIKYGTKKIIPLALLLVTLGIFFRSFFSLYGLFFGTALIGIGTGLLNVLIPSFFKEYYPNETGRMMGFYSTSLTFSSATIAGVIEPLEKVFNGWRGALLSVIILSIVAFLLSLEAIKGLREKEKREEKEKRKVKSLLISVYMGLQSLIFFSVLTWFPLIISSRYELSFNLGLLITIMQFASMIPAYFVPLYAKRENIKTLASLLAFLFIPGLLLSFFGGNTSLLIIGTIICGLSLGSTFSLSMALTTIRGNNSQETAQLLSFGQCFGYIMASFGPTGLGYTFDAFNSWTPAVIILVFLALLMSLVGYLNGRN